MNFTAQSVKEPLDFTIIPNNHIQLAAGFQKPINVKEDKTENIRKKFDVKQNSLCITPLGAKKYQ